MSKGIRPGDPSRSDHRLIAYILRTFFKNKHVRQVPEEFDHVSEVFKRAGGSWERLFRGSAEDVNLLRQIVKLAIRTGHISKEPKFR